VRLLPFCFVALLVAGCSSKPAEQSKLIKEADQVKVGMEIGQVREICGKPDQGFNDPISGGEVWFYKDRSHGKMLTVTFTADEVVKVHLSSL
jgi:hypothetical protein